MIVTLAQLRRLEACTPQLEFFQRQFGTEVTVTRELCLKYASNFDWDWAASRLLSAPARRDYDEAMAPPAARRVCDEAMAAARRAYDEAREVAWRARRAYDEALAVAFADAANG